MSHFAACHLHVLFKAYLNLALLTKYCNNGQGFDIIKKKV